MSYGNGNVNFNFNFNLNFNVNCQLKQLCTMNYELNKDYELKKGVGTYLRE